MGIEGFDPRTLDHFVVLSGRFIAVVIEPVDVLAAQENLTREQVRHARNIIILLSNSYVFTMFILIILKKTP